MIELLAQLRSEKNGEVSELMTEHGLGYALNYGVSTFVIRQIALQYAYDTALAELLYRQQVRELQIAAYTIAEPQDVTVEQCGFWEQRIVNAEMAEQASRMFAASPQMSLFVRRWLKGDNSTLQYCAMLCLAKTPQPIEWQVVEDYVTTLHDTSANIIRVLSTLLSEYHNEPHAAQIIDRLQASSQPLHQQIAQEIFIND